MIKKRASLAPEFTTKTSPQAQRAVLKRITIGKNPKYGFGGRMRSSVEIIRYVKWVDGKMIRGSEAGLPEKHHPYRNMIANLVDAIFTATENMEDDHQGYVVYRFIRNEYGMEYSREKLYEAKWSAYHRPYIALSPLGEKILGALAKNIPITPKYKPLYPTIRSVLEYLSPYKLSTSPIPIR